jgi:intracellular septation protein A
LAAPRKPAASAAFFLKPAAVAPASATRYSSPYARRRQGGTAGVRPMGTALARLAEDFLSTLVFLGLYFATGNLAVAVGAAVAVGVGQYAIARWKRRPVDAMQWISLALAVTLGAAALISNDSRFMMAKPSVVHFALGAVMLRPGWMSRYMPPIVRENVPAGVLTTSGYAWAALMFTLGLLNLYVALNYSTAVWGWFISVGAVGAKVAAFLVQYMVLRILIGRTLRAAGRYPEGNSPAP